MNVLRRFSVLVVVAAVSLGSRTARADPSATSPAEGWALILFSALTGAAITSVSANIDCRPDDLECAGWASLGIWGGIGVAAGGAVAGILVVRSETRTQSPPPPRLERSSGAALPMCTF